MSNSQGSNLALFNSRGYPSRLLIKELRPQFIVKASWRRRGSKCLSFDSCSIRYLKARQWAKNLPAVLKLEREGVNNNDSHKNHLFFSDTKKQNCYIECSPGLLRRDVATSFFRASLFNPLHYKGWTHVPVMLNLWLGTSTSTGIRAVAWVQGSLGVIWMNQKEPRPHRHDLVSRGRYQEEHKWSCRSTPG